MLKPNDPAREGEAAVCLLGGDNIGHISNPLRAEVLTRRFRIPPHRAALVGTLIWGTAHG